MAYGLKYTFTFQDQIYESPATFRIEIEQKDYVGAETALPILAEAPVILERVSSDESKITSIIGTKLSVQVVYTGFDGIPHPRVFKDIQEDTFRVSLFKNDILNFKGFIKPDATQYPFSDPAFTYTINATDYFNGMKSAKIDLNVSGLFYYGYISFADFISRTIFNVVDYSDPIIKVLFNIAPLEMSEDKNILSGLFIHTDSFYTVEDGLLSIYDALNQFLKSFRARIFFSDGTYWLQRLSDTYYPYTQVIQYEYPLSIDTEFPVAKSQQQYKSDFEVLEGSANVRTTPAIYRYVANYKLKAINQLVNFAWMEFTEPNTLTGWDVFSVFNMDRVGSGAGEDPYRLRIFEPSPGPGTPNMRQDLEIEKGQRVQIQLKIASNYAKDIGLGVVLGDTTDPDNAYALSADGTWIHLVQGGTTYIYFPIGLPLTGLTSVDITSKPVPEYAPNNNLHFYITPPRPVDDPATPIPPGEQTWAEIYPAFLRIFKSDVNAIETTATNDKVFSHIPETEDMVYLDTNDAYVSNTVFVDNGTEIIPVPPANWTDDGLPLNKTLDYLAGQTILDNFNVPSNVFEGDIRSNTLEFHQQIKIEEIDDGVTLLQLSDTYNLQTGIHSIVAEQIFPKSYGDGTYVSKSIIKT